MNIRIHENGWTVIVEDINLKEVTQEQVNQFAKYLLTNTVVVFRGQQLTPEEEIRFCEMFGEVQVYEDHRSAFLLKEGHKKINRVTGEKDEHGEPGMFGHVQELEWHCNRVSDPDRRPIIYLYGDRGTAGSRTSWLNNILTYNDLPQEKKDEFANYSLNVGNTQQFVKYYKGDEYTPTDITYYRPKLVHTNLLGITGLFFSWNQTHFIEELDHQVGRKIIQDLKEWCDQEKYMYHHDWEDGDLVLSDQWLSLHKRWEFEHMDRRVLHRIAMDYSHININQLKNLHD
jgi:alpha-ketoglutarate-dependent taurine dioxygenase